MWCVPQSSPRGMRRLLQIHPRSGHCSSSRGVFRPERSNLLIKCSNSWPFRSAHYDVLASNPFWYFYFYCDLWCCSHFKGHAPLTRCMVYFLAEFHMAMKLSQVCKWCISSDGRTQQILCCLLILNFCCKFPHCIIWPAGQGIFPGPAGFSPALCDHWPR